MSFLSRLFGGKSGDKPGGSAAGGAPAEARTTGQIEHKGFTVRAVPYKAAGGYQLAGVIEKVVDGVPKTHRFVRADRSTQVDEVTELALHKGRQMIDEQGDALFGD